MATSSNPSSSSEPLIQTLTNSGWCFQHIHQIKTLIETKFSEASTTIRSIESELCNMDLRAIGGKSLPDSSTLRKSTHIQGPKVLQVCSVRDISKSSIAESSGGSSGKRLLRLKLTDGHIEVTAIEFTHIPSLPDNVVPGTKIRLENKVVIHSGILCLNAKVVTVLGGIVPSLYEEWEMNQKYAGFTRSTVKPSQSDDTGGPPPFQKFQTGPPSRRINQQSRSSENSMATVKPYGPTGSLLTSGSRVSDKKADSGGDNVKSGSTTEKNEEKQPATEARPKEVAESIPVQNQAAAQKLLQKMNYSNRNEGHSRGWKQRGRGKEENESAVLTIAEWERKRANGSSSLRQENANVNQDEDLARQLQNQFDLEDYHGQQGQHVTEADDIRMSMFSFNRDDPGAHDRGEFRGRGRGRGRGRRGRGRGRGG
ncbi:putative RecQ mediated genome instability protein [Helianthus annuus]|nr:putative RecQ mediated genome instability protein [Helianthus annuus]